MTIPVKELKGITDEVVAKLKEQGITNSEQFLKAATTPKQRKELSVKLNTSTNFVLELANRADLDRITGIGRVFSDLLEVAGVDTVKEMSKRDPKNLHAKLTEVNAQQKLASRVPTPAQVEDWVKQAKALPAGLEY
jgi:predicted flap endonuclease-1-like 5' DNA nuclease